MYFPPPGLYYAISVIYFIYLCLIHAIIHCYCFCFNSHYLSRDLSGKKTYVFAHVVIPLYESIFLSAKFHSFSAWRTYFNISYNAGVPVMYSFSFCISERVLLSFLKGIFAGYRIWGWWFFSFCSFKDVALLSSWLVSFIVRNLTLSLSFFVHNVFFTLDCF